MNNKLLLISILITIAIIITFIASLIYGSVYVPIRYLFRHEYPYSFIIYQIRFPTSISTLFIGADLAVSGLILQKLLKNPLMDPYISGTSSGAAFGATLSYIFLLFGIPLAYIFYIAPLTAFLFASIATLITILIGKSGDVYRLVIAGIAVSYIFSSLIMFEISILQEKVPELPSVYFWIFGYINYINYTEMVLTVVISLIFLAFTMKYARIIDLVAISDEMSFAHKVNPNRFRLLWVLAISLLISMIISFTGIIGFVGLMTPHLVRGFLGGRSSYTEIPYVAMMGGMILLVSKIISKGAFGFTVPITAVTAILAFPIIIYVLVRRIGVSQ